jgi:hypothetical protein
MIPITLPKISSIAIKIRTTGKDAKTSFNNNITNDSTDICTSKMTISCCSWLVKAIPVISHLNKLQANKISQSIQQD